MVRNVTARVVSKGAGVATPPVRTELVEVPVRAHRAASKSAEVVLLRPIALPLLLAKVRETLR